MTNKLRPFHLAMPVDDLDAAHHFYGEILQCKVGRRSGHWIDFDFFGHQLVVHQVTQPQHSLPPTNEVDGHQVPVPHFGVVLEWQQWQQLSQHLTNKNISFVIKPYIRFAGTAGEQATLFFKDPAGNFLEFKAFKDPKQLFAR